MAGNSNVPIALVLSWKPGKVADPCYGFLPLPHLSRWCDKEEEGIQVATLALSLLWGARDVLCSSLVQSEAGGRPSGRVVLGWLWVMAGVGVLWLCWRRHTEAVCGKHYHLSFYYLHPRHSLYRASPFALSPSVLSAIVNTQAVVQARKEPQPHPTSCTSVHAPSPYGLFLQCSKNP